MIPAATFDPSRRLDLYFRVDRNGSKVLTFTNSDGQPYSLIYDEFKLIIKENSGSRKNKVLLEENAGLTISINSVTVDITSEQSHLPTGEYYWELYNEYTGTTYLSGKAYFHNGEFDGVDNDAEDVVINLSGESITISIEDSRTDSVDLVPFTTVLKFNYDQDLETITGGTTTFSVSVSGNLNGVAILARINNPVAVNFPASSEIVNGSDTISTTSMNIIVFRYFVDYDGSGNDKILYVIKNQNSV